MGGEEMMDWLFLKVTPQKCSGKWPGLPENPLQHTVDGWQGLCLAAGWAAIGCNPFWQSHLG
jgi:hypothetical protein